ncbi:hypothetical protein CCR75_009593 [Bremia lactucae]|uniref:Uncharacterized protein n=1 Tax=Bremia lactucae TaxID=4779 RepID=A0A976FNG5_BRELC|nr:hypothetical protein CCR75_009593 [Bremia lactucae]
MPNGPEDTHCDVAAQAGGASIGTPTNSPTCQTGPPAPKATMRAALTIERITDLLDSMTLHETVEANGHRRLFRENRKVSVLPYQGNTIHRLEPEERAPWWGDHDKANIFAETWTHILQQEAMDAQEKSSGRCLHDQIQKSSIRLSCWILWLHPYRKPNHALQF